MATMLRSIFPACSMCSTRQLSVIIPVRHNSNRCSIVNVKRKLYRRLYPTTIVQPDGSTFTVRYHEPRRIIKLPLDVTTLSEEERLQRLLKRKVIKKIEIKEEEEDIFNANKYQYLWKNKKK